MEFFSLIIFIFIFYIKVCNFVVGLFFLELVEKFGVAPVYASFGAVSLLAAAFAHYFLVETKGRSLEEIERSLNSKAWARDKYYDVPIHALHIELICFVVKHQ